MTTPRAPEQGRQPILPTKNLLLLATAVAVLVGGYAVLAAGHASAGAVLLVLGYCVLFPLGIAS